MCHIEIKYDMNYKFMCDHCKNENCSRLKFMNHKERLHYQFGAQRCSLYNIYHIDIDYNMNHKFMCDHCKNKIYSKTWVKESQEKDLIINLEPKCVHYITYVTLKGTIAWIINSCVIAAKLNLLTNTS